MVWPIDRIVALGVWAAWLLWAGPSVRASEPDRPSKPLRALILSGGEPQGPSATTTALKCILTDSGRFDVRVCESPSGLSLSTLSSFDLVVVATGLERGSDTAKAVAAFVAAGKGLVVTQGAFETSEVPDDWPLIAGGQPRPPVRFLDVKVAGSDHPIAHGMNRAFRTADSVPDSLAARPGAAVIATTSSGSGTVPVLAASTPGTGRIVALVLGCDASAMHEPQFRALLARAGEWAASGAVTLPATLRPSGPAADAVKALLITGGHDHEAAFYSLFSGDRAIDWLPVDTAANAFKKDLRGQYDLIIMYDFTRDLDDAGKQNLRAFVESGKGVVVLHHALLNYQAWTWWSEEVVGGRYRLRREGASPSSSVKNDQQIWVRPAGTHPVLNGIHPFHIVDESYKNLYLSPRIQPLLTTDNPTSDTHLAWIGPCATSRVVAIQLGHGHSAFGHPSYRALVHNAVLWAAGRASGR
ncbi:MAG TPA: ThuA domain-containing protein [Isosphaeraceae bacterium]|nr:ThuA domain-containing protein [Isosphaeraceae bacterium]